MKKVGFSLTEIYDMTLDQIALFMKAIANEHRITLKEAVITQTAGARYDEKSLKQLLKDLED